MSQPLTRLYLWVGAGGALGGGCRYLLGLWLADAGLPWATLLANCAGSLLIGWYVALPTASRWTREPLHLFVTAGFCGGFTTFSLFSLETITLLQQDWQSGLLWAAVSLLLWLLSVTVGYRAGKLFLDPERGDRMDWAVLLNKARLGQRSAKDESGRTAFLRDHDKIIFSGAFRRLARKTQVHPLATNDHVHNRLTHSLEVSCVGRTLGIQVGQRLALQKLLPEGTDATDLGDIVQSACLAHDIGNPPFGHTGERAIRAWFRHQGSQWLNLLSDSQRNDLALFEGNAQGFRILTKSEYHQYDDGMRLTYATLATFLKYPWLSSASDKPDCPRRGKYSAFVADSDAFEETCRATGLHKLGEMHYVRHPLAYLVEAADDFCYAIIDLEDGLEMDLLHWDEVHALLAPAFPDSEEVRTLLQSDMRVGRKAALLRGKIIERFIDAGVETFMANHDKLLAGTLEGDLISHCEPAVRNVVENAKQLARTKVFEHPRKIELEIGAFEVIGTLLGGLIEAAVSHARNDDSNYRHQRIIDLIGRHSFPPTLDSMEEQQRIYECIMRAVDFLAGMTDNYATYLAKQFAGMAETRY